MKHVFTTISAVLLAGGLCAGTARRNAAARCRRDSAGGRSCRRSRTGEAGMQLPPLLPGWRLPIGYVLSDVWVLSSHTVTTARTSGSASVRFRRRPLLAASCRGRIEQRHSSATAREDRFPSIRLDWPRWTFRSRRQERRERQRLPYRPSGGRPPVIPPRSARPPASPACRRTCSFALPGCRRLRDQLLVGGDIALRHVRGRETRFEISGAPRIAVEGLDAADGSHGLVDRFDDIAAAPGPITSEHGAVAPGDHRRAGRHRLDHHEAEGLDPVDRKQQRQAHCRRSRTSGSRRSRR